MIDNLIYQEYNTWTEKNKTIISFIMDNETLLSLRLKPIKRVLDYFYDELIDVGTSGLSEENLFETGFDYLYNVFDLLSNLLTLKYNNDYETLLKFSSDIDLLFSTKEFYEELSIDPVAQEELQMIEEVILSYLYKLELVPKDIRKQLDYVSVRAMDKNRINYLSITSIFLKIMDLLDIFED